MEYSLKILNDAFVDIETAFDYYFQISPKLAVKFNKEYAFIYATSDGFVTKKIANEGEIIAGGMPVFAINENIKNSWVLRVGLSDKDSAVLDPAKWKSENAVGVAQETVRSRLKEGTEGEVAESEAPQESTITEEEQKKAKVGAIINSRR